MIKINWSQFKALLETDQIRARFITTSNGYEIHGADQGLIYSCSVVNGESDCVDFETNFKNSIALKRAAGVNTEFERNDIVLKLASMEGVFSNGQCVLQIKVPGTPGVDVRYAGGGYAFTDNWTFGDRCKLVEVVDVDNIFGFGAGAVLKTYHDEEAEDSEMGWRLYPTHGGHGEIEIDSLGFYGTIISGLYLRVTFVCANATKAAVDCWWGTQE